MKLNKVIIGGRLGGDPENNSGAVRFSIATDDSYKRATDGVKVEETNWHRIVAFGKLGEIIEKYCKKGDEIIIMGALKYRKHEDKWYTSITASEFTFVSSPKRDNPPAEEQKQSNESTGNEPDDLPF